MLTEARGKPDIDQFQICPAFESLALILLRSEPETKPWVQVESLRREPGSRSGTGK